jgi:ribonuclease G
VSGTLLIAASPGELWAALVAEEKLRELRVFRAEAGRGRVGEVILGRVVALKPDLPAALVDIGVARPAFLSAEDAAPGSGIAALTEGAAIIVQVTKEARADKAVGVSTRLRLAGRFVDLTPGRPGVSAAKGVPPADRDGLLAALRESAGAGEGLVLRAARAGAAPADLAADAESLRARWRAIEAARARVRAPAPLEPPPSPLATLLAAFVPAMPEAIVIDDRAAFAQARAWLTRHRAALVERLSLHREQQPLFEHHGVAGDIAAALCPRVLLPEGGTLTIELTAAATMIDVDSGGVARGRNAAAAMLAANLAAAQEAARQIGLRNLAGPIVIDFVGMRDRRDRDRVRAALTAALADDGDAEVLGWTRLGHLELVRKRRHAPLAELLFERLPGGGLAKTPLTVALEALRVLAREAAAAPVRAPVLHVHPEVATALSGEAGVARRELEGRLGRAVDIVAEPGRARDGFDIVLG